MTMRLALLVILVGWIGAGCFAQSGKDSVEIEVNVGDSITISACPGPHFMHLDYFRKTRWAGPSKPYDTATGHGFYASFFTTGDFDIYDLPPSYSGKTFVVLGMEVLTNKKNGDPLYIMYLKGPDPNSVIWVDFYEAVGAGEIKFVRYR